MRFFGRFFPIRIHVGANVWGWLCMCETACDLQHDYHNSMFNIHGTYANTDGVCDFGKCYMCLRLIYFRFPFNTHARHMHAISPHFGEHWRRTGYTIRVQTTRTTNVGFRTNEIFENHHYGLPIWMKNEWMAPVSLLAASIAYRCFTNHWICCLRCGKPPKSNTTEIFHINFYFRFFKAETDQMTIRGPASASWRFLVELRSA